MTRWPARGDGMANEGAQDPPGVVEAARRRQDPVLIIDKTGAYVQIDGARHRLADHRALAGIALQCLIAHHEAG